ncbi:Aspartyl protease [Handroanthus impetiginosus]|uniref:Aspartyl protease n=1 Tax=Handroanthus impetiginosus TaxID=429701 RepID=A0A2G9HXF4_9LAMI|nr:Aspartyl protease [Handroanthus impetiginosus]
MHRCSFMASPGQFFLFLLLNFLISDSVSRSPILPKAAIIPVSKDLSTLQYVSEVFMGENLAPVKLVVDLNGPFVWSDCEFKKPIKGCSLKCSMVKSIRGCSSGVDYDSKTCTLEVENTISRVSTYGEMNEGRMGMEFWDEMGLGSLAINEQFLVSCAPNLLLEGLATGAKGMLGLGNSRISLPSQFSTTFGFFERKFSLCLSPSKGAIFLGGNPYETQISSSMMYTPLISKKDGLQEGYYMDVSSIKICGKKLSLHQEGFVGTKISTTVPYTTMETNIYGTFVEAYVKDATSMNLTLVPPMAPFGVCFSSKGVENQRGGPNVPIIDLVLQSEMVKWRIHGRNSMVHVSDEVMCLGILDGGLSPKDSIVLGGYQMEDNVLEFNLGNSMLGFSSSLLLGQKRCSDFESRVVL